MRVCLSMDKLYVSCVILYIGEKYTFGQVHLWMESYEYTANVLYGYLSLAIKNKT